MWTLEATSFDRLPNWVVDDHLAALAAFAQQQLKPSNVQYKLGASGVAPEDLDKLAARATNIEAKATPKAFFEDNFTPFNVNVPAGNQGQVTGFYEPEVEARQQRDEQFQIPIFGRPTDLIALDDNNRPLELDKSFRFGRRRPDGEIQAYFDRAQINRGAIDHTAEPIAFLHDPIEAFFIHIQGAARLILGDGTTMRVTYDGKSGHPFTSIGKLLVQRNQIDANKVSMQSIKGWLHAHPDKAMQLMEENRSYVFFKRSEPISANFGPIAAAKVPLSAGRSLAVDRQIHTFGTPIFINADSVSGEIFSRLMIAQETGTAIVGPARGDIFFGSGDMAGEIAGAVNSRCDFTILVPNSQSSSITGSSAS